MGTLLEIDGLTKYFRHPWTFRRFCALDRLSLAVREGEIFGLIGHNGAGKTTTFKLLLGFLRPSAGQSSFMGRPSTGVWARTRIGFLPEQPYFYDYLTVRETLVFYARLSGLRASDAVARTRELARQLRVEAKLEAPIRTLSKGMLQRLGVAQAIIHRPKLVILDEPMSGLDPIGRKEMRALIQSLKSSGTTVFFSSHILPDAEALCDRVGILAEGRLREIVDLAGNDGGAEYALTVRGVPPGSLPELAALTVPAATPAASVWTVRVAGRERVREYIDRVHAAGGFVESLVPTLPSLEERFLHHAQQVHVSD